jgi:hypothetical protein
MSFHDRDIWTFGDFRSPNWAQILFVSLDPLALSKHLLYRRLGGVFFFIYCLSLICFTYKYSSQHYSNVADVKTFVATHTIPSLHSASPARITSLAVSRTIHSHGYNGEYSILPTYAPRALSLSLAYWLLAAPTLSDYNLCRVELHINDRIWSTRCDCDVNGYILFFLTFSNKLLSWRWRHHSLFFGFPMRTSYWFLWLSRFWDRLLD